VQPIAQLVMKIIHWLGAICSRARQRYEQLSRYIKGDPLQNIHADFSDCGKLFSKLLKDIGNDVGTLLVA